MNAMQHPTSSQDDSGQIDDIQPASSKVRTAPATNLIGSKQASYQ